jgi:hypothetical protein
MGNSQLWLCLPHKVSGYEEKTFHSLGSFSTEESKPPYQITPIPHFQSLTCVTLGQEWMQKLDIFSANALGPLQLPAVSGGQQQFRCKYAI